MIPKIFILLIGITIAGCSSSKKTKTVESRWIYFINYSKEEARFVYYTKSNEEDNYEERGSTNLSPPGNYYYPHDNASSANEYHNFYKIEYYLSDKLIGTREHTRKELLVDKQGELYINKRGKIKK